MRSQTIPRKMRQICGAFQQALQELGIDGRNTRLDYRWESGDPERIRTYAADLAHLAPDVILVGEIEQAIEEFAREPNGGLIMLSKSANLHRKLIIDLATRHRLPQYTHIDTLPGRGA